MIINHNLNAMNAHRQMTGNVGNAGKSMEKLSSGLRINRAGDDAAGLAISEKMRGQIRGLDQAGRNSQDSISMIQTAEGALNETHSILQRMRELGVQAGNDTNTSTDRNEIQKEMNQLSSEINRIGNTTEFNNQKLLNGTGGTVVNGTPVPAAGGKAEGTAVTCGAGTKFDVNNLKFDVVVGGTTKTVTLNKDYDGTANKDLAEIAKDIGTAIGSGVTVTATGGKLTIAAANATDNVEIKAATVGNISAIGLTAGVSSATAATTTASKSSFTSQVGANENQTMTLDFVDMRANALGITGTGAGFTATNGVTNGTNNNPAEAGLDVSDSTKAGNAVTKIQSAINTVSAERSKLGAYQNRLEHTINNLGTSSENLSAAESRIRDVDMAKEMMQFSKNNILSQASQAMLAQAKSQPEAVLQLLR